MNRAPAIDPAPATAEPVEPGTSPWGDAWHRLRRNRLAIFGGGVIALLAFACFFGPALFGLSYVAQGLNIGGLPPGSPVVKIVVDGRISEVTDLPSLIASRALGEGVAAESALAALREGREVTVADRTYRPSIYLLGADSPLGRDLFARILFGGRISLLVGLVASLVALIIGVTYGAIAGYAGGKTDLAMMRFVDIVYALPFTVFVILMMVLLKEPTDRFDAALVDWSIGGWRPFGQTRGVAKIVMLFAAIGAVEWLTMARIVRAQVQSLKRMEFIEAARAMGFSRRRVLFRHLVPNILGPVVVYTTLTIPGVMLLEAFLSFLGLGVEAPMSSWGTLIEDGTKHMEEQWWLLVFPGGLFALTLLSFNFVGDGLRDALDVRSAKD